jgi:predicted TIM-barrel fold metal-dependent hydrolase
VMKVIDAHTHLGEFPVFGESITLEGLLALMDEYGIEKAVVSALPNSLTREAIEKHPERFTGLVRVNPHEADAAAQADEAISDKGFKGIKLNPLFNNFLPDSSVVDPVMEVAARHRVPVLIHSGHPPWSLPWSFERLADRFPEVTIVMAHMGHGHIVYINAALDVAEDHQNIAVDTAGMTMHGKIREAVTRLGDHRVMYGSDTPLGHPAWEIPKVRVSGLDEEQLSKVLYENAETIYGM